MKGSLRKAGCALLSILAVVALAGCPPVTPTTTVSVSPASAVVEVNQTITLEVESTDAADTSFTWTTSDADVVALNQTTGTSITVHGVAAGSATISATGSSSGIVGKALISVPQESQQPGQIQPALLAPGLNVTIKSVTIPAADRKPEVSFTATNNKGQTIALSELSTIRVILAHLTAPEPGGTAKFTSYTTTAANGQANYDSNQFKGLTQAADGTFTYKFAAALPAGYDAASVHEVGMQIARLYAIDNQNYPANPIYTFRPDGGAPVTGRAVVATATCVKCHTRLEFHGGQRREIQLCILCHNPQSVDPESGNSVDMTEMIHKIHMGAELPSVKAGGKYQIIGFNNSVNDYSKVVFPQSVANCTSCHDEAAAPQAKNYLSNPTIEACGSCHDRTWFGDPSQTPTGYTNHPFNYEHVDSSDCKDCHKESAQSASPIGLRHAAVTVPGIVTKILQVTPNAQTGALQVQFKLTYADGTPITNVKTPDRVGAIVAWPTTDYQNAINETLGGARTPTGTLDVTTSDTGIYNYTFKATLPTGTTDTFAIVMTGRIAAQDRHGNTIEQGTLDNSLMYFRLDGGTPAPRRQVVEEQKCDACHKEIRFHGEQRFGVDTCVMCHRPNAAEGEATINFKEMLHYIHSGAELENGYALGDFSDVHFPGNRAMCTMCHVAATSTTPGTFEVPLPADAKPTVIGEGDTATQIPATRAACTSCHDSTAADTHAFLASNAQGVESCAVCHGANADDAVALVHKQTP
jgi:OmcA/MtrC family decaheme c-type cytochrome